MNKDMKTLVIHPPDETTSFLSQVYEGKDWTVIDYTPHKWELKTALNEHDRIIMMGHGSPRGLFGAQGYTIDATWVYLLRDKLCVCMWCNADQFVLKYNLKGFYTGMIISEVQEARYLNVPHDLKYVNESNVLFTNALTKSMDADDVLQSMITEYSNKTDNPVIEYNEQRLYHTDNNVEISGKGKELVDMYLLEVAKTFDENRDSDYWRCLELAKKLALIYANEMIAMAETIWEKLEERHTVEYWEEVKREINNVI